MPKKNFYVILVFLAILAIYFLSKNFFPFIINTLFNRNATVQSTNGQTNILLLGTGGGQHAGADLSDTIMVANLNRQTDAITLISLPRDLWIASLGTEGEKINQAYADGQVNNQKKGLLLAKAAVEKVIKQPIHYGFRIDFSGFVKAVDLIGGIDVNVAETLDDYHYPIDGFEDATCGHNNSDIQSFMATAPAEPLQWDFFSCRYIHLHVPAGMQHMSGTTALEFVRSRHGVGYEGGDFARARRQQRVVEAFRAKVLSLGILLNPTKLFGLYDILQSSIDTDIPQQDILPFIQLFQQMKGAKIRTVVVDDGSSTPNKPGLLIDATRQTSYGDVFTLDPRVGYQNFSEVQAFIACSLQYETCMLAPTPGVSPIPLSSPTSGTKN